MKLKININKECMVTVCIYGFECSSWLSHFHATFIMLYIAEQDWYKCRIYQIFNVKHNVVYWNYFEAINLWLTSFQISTITNVSVNHVMQSVVCTSVMACVGHVHGSQELPSDTPTPTVGGLTAQGQKKVLCIYLRTLKSNRTLNVQNNSIC